MPIHQPALAGIAQCAAPPGANHNTVVMVFCLGAEEYGVPIDLVQELCSYECPTALANAPDHLKGVISLRGEIIPIIDLRLRLNMGIPTYDQFTTIIILEVASRRAGAVVDRVCDVVALTPLDVRRAPAIGGAADSLPLDGVGIIDGRILLLVDMPSLLFFDSEAVA